MRNFDDQLSDEIVPVIHRIVERSRRREYRYALAAGILAVVAAIASITAWYMYRDAQRLAAGDLTAHRTLERTTETLDQVLTQAATEFRSLPGTSERSLGEALTRIEAEFARFAAEPAGKSDTVLRRNAELFVQFSTSYEALGAPQRALASAGGARRALEAVSDRQADDDALMATALLAEGDARMDLDDPEGARAAYQAATEIREALAATAQENRELQHALSIAFERLGQADAALEAHDAATRYLQRSLAIRQTLADDRTTAEALEPLALAHTNLGDHAFQRGAFDEAAEHYDNAHRVYEELGAEDPETPDWTARRAQQLARAGRARASGGASAAGLDQLEEAAGLYRALIEQEPDTRQWLIQLAEIHEWTGGIKHTARDLPGARAAYTRALDIRRAEADRDSGDTRALGAYATVLTELARVDRSENLDQTARQRIAEAIDMRRAVHDARPDDVTAKTALVENLVVAAEMDLNPRRTLSEALELLVASEDGPAAEFEPLAEDIRDRLARLSD